MKKSCISLQDSKQKSFALIELQVVITIIVLLAGMLQPTLNPVICKSNINRLRNYFQPGMDEYGSWTPYPQYSSTPQTADLTYKTILKSIYFKNFSLAGSTKDDPYFFHCPGSMRRNLQKIECAKRNLKYRIMILSL